MPATTLDFPSSVEFMEIQQQLLPAILVDRKLLKLLPFEGTDRMKLIWDQLDDYVGLQQVRGLNGAPGRVQHTGSKRYVMEPGSYGEFETLDEKQMTEMAELGTPGEPLDFDEYSGKVAQKLLTRECDRMEVTISTLLRTGRFSNQNEDGSVIHTDQFPTQTFAPAVAWSDAANSTPLADMRAFQITAESQGSFDFGGGEIMANQRTVNHLLNNRNENDLWGLRIQYGAQVNFALGQLNELLVSNDLPKIVVYKRFYRPTAGSIAYIIPDNSWIWIGKRQNNERIGTYMLTRNIIAENVKDDLYGEGEETDYGYYKIRDRRQEVPPSVEFHRGHNGGPVLFFPSAVACIAY